MDRQRGRPTHTLQKKTPVCHYCWQQCNRFSHQKLFIYLFFSESSGDFLQFSWDSPIYYFGCLLQLNFNNGLSCYCIKGCFGSSLIKMVVSSIPLAERYVMSGSLGFEVSPAGRLVQKWGGLHSLIPVTPRKWTKAASVLLQTTDIIQLIFLNLFKQAWWSVRQQCYYHLSRYKKTDVKEFCPQGTSSTDCQDELYIYTVSCDDCWDLRLVRKIHGWYFCPFLTIDKMRM